MKAKRIAFILMIAMFFCSIWSKEPVKFILSGLLVYYTIKLTIADDKVIGSELIDKHSPIDFSRAYRSFNVKFKNW